MSTLTDNENKLYLLILTIVIIFFFPKKKKKKKKRKKTSLPHKDGTWYNELRLQSGGKDNGDVLALKGQGKFTGWSGITVGCQHIYRREIKLH